MKLLYNNKFNLLIDYLKLVMKDPAGKTGNCVVRFVFRLLSVIYGGVVKLRVDMFRQKFFLSKKFPCKTISVGNLTVGGTGKTPFTVYIAGLIKSYGMSVVIVSRGYGGKLEKIGGIIGNGTTVLDSGDEPYLIAQLLGNVPVVVGKDRFRIGMKAIRKFNPDIMIFDDAFQHLKINFDLSLVLMDNFHPIGNGFMLPRGILREPLSALSRADGIIFTRSVSKRFRFNYSDFCPNFLCEHKMVLREIVSEIPMNHCIDFKGKTVIVFSGLADNLQFHKSLADFGFVVKGKISFFDHHKYNQDDVNQILNLQRRTRTQFIATTDKDYVKLTKLKLFPVPLLVFGINIEFRDKEKDFIDFISRFVF